MLTDDDKIFKVGYYELDNPHKNFWVLDGDMIIGFLKGTTIRFILQKYISLKEHQIFYILN